MSLKSLSWVGSNFYKERLFINVLGKIPKYQCICEERLLKNIVNNEDFDISKSYTMCEYKVIKRFKDPPDWWDESDDLEYIKDNPLLINFKYIP